jgi:hypothetical protein
MLNKNDYPILLSAKYIDDYVYAIKRCIAYDFELEDIGFSFDEQQEEVIVEDVKLLDVSVASSPSFQYRQTTIFDFL